MTLPVEYDQASVQQELDSLRDALRVLTQYISLIPLSAAPIAPSDGWLAISDGTGTGFDGASGKGLYRYNLATTTWVHLG
jgi:hypothetical protein